MAGNEDPICQALIVVDTDYEGLDAALPICLLIDARRRSFRVASAAAVLNGEASHLLCNYNIVIAMTRGDENNGAETAELVASLRCMTDLPLLAVGPAAQIANVSALLMGADMYLPLPLHEDEFFARIESLLRRYRNSNFSSNTELSHHQIYRLGGGRFAE